MSDAPEQILAWEYDGFKSAWNADPEESPPEATPYTRTDLIPQWQPIDIGLLKEGERFLVCNDRVIFAVEWDSEWNGGNSGWFMVSDGKDFERPLRGDTPTRRMPLPPLPSD